MTPPRTALIVALARLALAAGGPVLALAQETESAPASSVVEVPHPPYPVTLAAEPCTESRECALRLGYGNVSDQNRCEPYVDRRDIVDVFGPAAGFGARIMMSKESRTNLRVDFAWGVDSFAVYLGAGEVF